MNLDLPTLNDGRLHLELSTDKICFDHLTGVGLGEEQYRFILVQHRAIQLAKRILEHYKWPIVAEDEVPKVEENNSAQRTEISVSFPDKTLSIKQNGSVQILNASVLASLSRIWHSIDL